MSPEKAPVGFSQKWPQNAGRRILVQVAVEGGPADPQELGDVLAGVAVGLHPPDGGDGLVTR